MNGQRVCPFYGQSIDPCDVGAGYISPYHVEIIIRHCTSHYEECTRYQELSRNRLDSDGAESAQHLPMMDHRVCMPSGGVLFPLQFDREVMTVLNHEIRTPLTSIRSFTEILLAGPIEDRDTQRRFLQVVHDETVRLTRALGRLFGIADSSAPAPASIKSETSHRHNSNSTILIETSTP